MPVDAVSAVDVGYPQRFFYLLGDTSAGFRLATFHAVFGKTNYTPFGDGAFVVRGSFHYAAGAGGDGVGGVVALVGGEGGGTDIELASWSASGTRTVRCVASRPPPRPRSSAANPLCERARALPVSVSFASWTQVCAAKRPTPAWPPPTNNRTALRSTNDLPTTNCCNVTVGTASRPVTATSMTTAAAS